VLDGHPATLSWLGAADGHRVRPLGVEHFGQTGAIEDLYRHYGIDAPRHHRRRRSHRAGAADTASRRSVIAP
jgi:pyruvate dehydrogenase complex dehydrogenase (E1) component